MSTQTGRKYYCNTNQTLSGNNISVSSIVADVAKNTKITPEIYNQIIEILKLIHDFGDYDTTIRKPDISNFTETISNVVTLIFKNKEELITFDFYNDIDQSLELNRNINKNDIIYGEYFSDLIDAIKNYKIPSTRYYTYTYNCCDCYGECSCYGQCSCNGQCTCNGDCYSSDYCSGWYAGG